MLEKLQITNHGTNESKVIEFDSNVTTIIGRSYIGKSWILRALRWVSRNKPAGDSFITWDADEAKVKLTIDGRRVIRTRSKSINSYRLSGRKEPYVAFGNEVPKDIAAIINLSDINFQGQHSTPFWFCETAGEVSRQLNSIVNLELIDSTLANIASEIREANVVIKVIEKDLSKAVEQRKELNYVEDLNRDLENVERLQERHKEIAQKRATIVGKLELVAKYRLIQENAAQRALDGLKVVSIGDRWVETTQLVEDLSELVESGQNLQNILDNRPPSFSPLEKLQGSLDVVIEQVDSLDTLIESISNRRIEKCQIEEILKKCKKELEEIAGGRCPLCGGMICSQMKKS